MEKINKLGENIQLARADVITAGRGIELQCYAHPKGKCSVDESLHESKFELLQAAYSCKYSGHANSHP